ncbi:protein induced by osmotic stress [Scheffersomyces coipomensis]|uniref:protein induced by osmotic stress n=1 Tax=Scheffersomyces coipomensis TaxID=1788519 RepID=UPI00315DFEC4
MTASPTTVFISGATGFIAQHIITQLLTKGYSVVGSVRSTEKGESLVKIFNNPKFTFEVVKVLEKEGAFDEALKKHSEVTVFLHSASPVTFNAEDNERDILIPAIEGTKYVLKSIKEHAPQITRVVYTSSVVATGTPQEISDPNFNGGETTWGSLTYDQSKENGFAAYFGSKTFAEKAAWNFVETEKPNFTLSTVNPVYVFGPQNYHNGEKELNASAQMVGNILKLKPDDALPQLTGTFIDVRDVAKAHILAFETEKAQGKRFVLSNSRFDAEELVEVITKNIPELKQKLPAAKSTGDRATGRSLLDDSNARSILAIDYISLEQSVTESIKQILGN